MAVTYYSSASDLKNIPAIDRPAFLKKVDDISAWLQINPNWLMGIMKHESGINPSIVNSIGATGLIQFMPATAQGLKTTTSALSKMSAVRQLDYVKDYFAPYRGKIRTMTGLYVITFFPAALPYTNDDKYVFQYGNLSASAIANSNPGFDVNKNGQITMGEYKTYLRKYFGSDLLDSANPYFGKDVPNPINSGDAIDAPNSDGILASTLGKNSNLILIFLAIALIGGGFAFYKFNK